MERAQVGRAAHNVGLWGARGALVGVRVAVCVTVECGRVEDAMCVRCVIWSGGVSEGVSPEA